jgi:hypothetical protein
VTPKIEEKFGMKGFALPARPAESAAPHVELKPPPAGQVRLDMSMAVHHIQSLNAPKSKVCQ